MKKLKKSSNLIQFTGEAREAGDKVKIYTRPMGKQSPDDIYLYYLFINLIAKL